jgi:hypothetical protein
MCVYGQKAIRQEDCPLLTAIYLRYNCLFHLTPEDYEENKLLIFLFERHKNNALFTRTQIFTKLCV